MNTSKLPKPRQAATQTAATQTELPPDSPTSADASVGTQILCAVKGPIEPVAVSTLYLLAMVPVTLFMLLLPLFYVSLIAAVAYGLYWHATHDTFVFQPTAGMYGLYACLLVYVAPLLAGSVLIFFMIKPFFIRRGMGDKPFIVRREDEPLLYQYVNQLCDILRAKRPAHIEIDCQVNAAAGFKGPLSLITGKMVLVIGLPLAAGLNVTQFTGVLAHELGHFSQRSGMRLSYIIRVVNMWFARVVLQRDKWDLALIRASHRRSIRVKLFALLCRFVIWLTRRALWCLLWIAAIFSAIFSRRQEFDADTYQARVVGADVFEQTTHRIQALSVAFHTSMMELQNNWRERRLADDLPMLVYTREAEFKDDIRTKLTTALNDAKTGRFATHPAFRDRIAAARKLKAKPIITLDLSAAHLFTDFKELSRMTSIKFYQQILGKNLKAEHLYTTENLLDLSQARRQNFTALQRYFQNLISPHRPLNIFSAEMIPESAEARGAIIMEARTKLCAAVSEAAADAKAFAEAGGILDRVTKVRALQLAQIKFDPGKFNLQSGSAAELADLEKQAILVRKQAAEVLDEILAPQARRIQAALASSAAPKTSPTEETYDLNESAAASGRSAIIETLRAVTLCRGQIESLRPLHRKFAALLSLVRPTGNSSFLVGEIIGISKTISRELANIHTQLRAIPYPYKHTERGASVSRFCCTVIPPQNKYRPLCIAAQNTLSGWETLYMRLMSDLAQQAEEAERALGLPPLSEPKQS